METEKFCPFCAFEPCPEAQCKMWAERLGECALVVSLIRDDLLEAAATDAENWKVAADEANAHADSYREGMQGLEARLEGMVPRAEYDRMHDLSVARGMELTKRDKELEDARAELGEWRLMGGARGKVKGKDARAELEDKYDDGRR